MDWKEQKEILKKGTQPNDRSLGIKSTVPVPVSKALHSVCKCVDVT
jgi:hypothetical protein